MKTVKRILVLIAVIICCSCEKESHWLCHTYFGTYETTGILLEFSEDRTECEVTERDIAADPLGSHKTYRAYLNEEEKSFMLNDGDYDSRVIYRGKVIDFDHATLTWYENDKEISITIEALRYE
ncbi:MAG: hypothetical protein J5990_11560 [Bacteroidales bacterium]|nr:hypothetical protein [Bacteroidales bacterium]